MNTYNEYDSMFLSNDRCTHVEYFIAPQAFLEYKLSKCLRHTTREALAGSGTVTTLYRSHRIVCFHGIVMYNLGFNSRPTPVKNTHYIFPVASVAADINQRVQ